jgi:hypothetical protein
MWLLTAHADQKNSGTSFCVRFILNFEFNANEHKTTAFQVWQCYLGHCAPVFLILLPLGIDVVLR